MWVFEDVRRWERWQRDREGVDDGGGRRIGGGPCDGEVVAAGCLFMDGVEVVGLASDEFEGGGCLSGEFIPLVGVGPIAGIGDFDGSLGIWTVRVKEQVDGIVGRDEELIGTGDRGDDAGGDDVAMVAAAAWVFKARDHQGLIGRSREFG